MSVKVSLTCGTGSSLVVTNCQICNSEKLQSILFLGYLPPVNTMPPIGSRPHEQASYPAELLFCGNCNLTQLGLIVDPQILFPPEYSYSSGTTKILRDNFAELYQECISIISLNKNELVIDIGSNDGTLLSNFQMGGHKVLGVEPTLMSKIAIERGIPTEQLFFNGETAVLLRATYTEAKVITATNVFAHVENIHEVVEGILKLLSKDGVFISESHYFPNLVETLQYDTIYHEHLRYYSLNSLQYLLAKHDLEIIHSKRIPTHGGSIRVYAARRGSYPVRSTVKELLQLETSMALNSDKLKEFRQRVALSKLELYTLLFDIKKRGQRIFGVGAPSRASTLINYR